MNNHAVLRTPILSDREHRGYIWRSDWTGTAYRYRGGWQMFYQGRWDTCYNEDSHAMWYLYGNGETFIRVGKEL